MKQKVKGQRQMHERDDEAVDHEGSHETALVAVGRGPNNTLSVHRPGVMAVHSESSTARPAGSVPPRSWRPRAAVAVGVAALVATAAVATAAVDHSGGGSAPVASAEAQLTSAAAAAATQSATFSLSATAATPAVTTTLLSAHGAFDLASSSGEATATVPMLSSMTGGLVGGRGLELRVVNSTAYLQVPGSSILVSNGEWLAAPIGGSTTTSSGLAGLADPAALVGLLRDAGGPVTTQHGVDLDGSVTTEYSTSVTLASLAEKVSPQVAGSEVAALLNRFGLVSVPIEAWVDSSGLLRQVSISLDLRHADLSGLFGAALGVTTKGSGPVLTVVADLSNYGEPVSVAVPPSDQVVQLDTLFSGVSGVKHLLSGLEAKA